ncbi:MAG: CBS domain-containing protein [Tepidisphaeraceae bacterium]|jgi:sporulation protein YlmC with PRC-barrel domain
MDNLAAHHTLAGEKLFRLSDLLKRPVRMGEEKIGSLSDLVIQDKGAVAEVTHVCVHRPFGRPRFFVPWRYVEELTDKAVVLDPKTETGSLEKSPPAAVLLEDYIVDKKVLDVDGRELEVVYDVMLALKMDRLYVIGVDLSHRALLRRIGFRWLANLTASITDRMENDMVAWDLVEPLPEGIGSFAGDLRLKVVKDQLVKMPPVDVARILEQLSDEQRIAVFDWLEPAFASDALEELDPKAQREVIAAMPKERIAHLINAMSPGQAADVLAVLPYAQVQALFGLLNPVKARKVRAILDKQEWRAADYAALFFVKLRPDTTILQARESLRQAKENNAVAYLYVLDADDQLLGIIHTTDLLTSSDNTLIKDIMKSAAITLNTQSTLKEAIELFTRYGFLALPVIDPNGKMLGIVPYRDVMELEHRGLG